MLQYIFFGRLESEKGIDIIIDTIRLLIQQKKEGKNTFIDQAHFFICGDGSYRTQVMELSSQCSQVHYFGWIDKHNLIKKLGSCHYTLMPSRFLETFGLSALESLCMGIPVIGYAKGGLRNFIPNYLDIDRQKGNKEAEKLSRLLIRTINTHSLKTYQAYSNKALTVSSHYTEQQRINTFTTLFHQDITHFASPNKKQQGNPKTILLISDYRTNFGGIETYIDHIDQLLYQAGYKVELRGARFPTGSLGKWCRNIGLIASALNIRAYISLIRTYYKKKPDLVRRHSTHRWIGRVGRLASRSMKAVQRLMHHDLGCACPYPHKIYEESQLLNHRSYKHFISSHQQYQRRQKPFIRGKYLTLSLSRQTIKKTIHRHLVPAPFLQPIIQHIYGKATYSTFPHPVDQFFAGICKGIQNGKNDSCQSTEQ